MLLISSLNCVTMNCDETGDNCKLKMKQLNVPPSSFQERFFFFIFGIEDDLNAASVRVSSSGRVAEPSKWGGNVLKGWGGGRKKNLISG